MARKDRSQKQGRAEVPLDRLRILGDPALRQPTKAVTVFDSRLEKLAAVMIAVMRREEGVGLAAPQIGVPSRVMVWRHPDEEDKEYVFVNPEIVSRSEECNTAGEGCLSVPGCTVELSRNDEVVVTAQDLEGNPLELEAAGIVARIMQHEIDHLDGRLILDRVTPEERRRVLKELRERTLGLEANCT
jgi:peptide deformylase